MSRDLSPQTGETPDYEYSLANLISSIWQTRMLIGIGALIAAAIACIVMAWNYLDQTKKQSLVAHIELTAISDGAYPSGARFSPSDLVSEEVLSTAKQSLELPDETPLNEAVTVEYGHPALANLRHARDRAQQQAESNNIPIEDMQAVRQSYQERINALSRGGLRIRLDLELLGVSPETGAIIAKTIPETWQQIYRERYRILLPPAISDLSRVAVSNDFDNADAPLAADRYLRQARQTLNAISNDARISSVTAPNGASASELIYELDQFRQIFFDPFLASRVVDESNSLGQLFIRDLRAERRQLNTLLDETTRTIETVARMRSNAGLAADNSANGRRAEGQPVLSLNDEGVRSIIDLAEQSSMQDYLTQLFDRRYQLTEQIAAIETRINKFTDAESLKSLAQTGMADVIAARFRNFEEEVSALVSAANQLASQSTDSLYELLAEPDLPTDIPTPQEAGIIFGISSVMGGLLGLLLGVSFRGLKNAQ